MFCLLTHIPKVEMQERFFLLALTVLAVTPAFLRSIIQLVADAELCVQALMDEIVMLQEEIGELQTCFSEELADSDSDGEPGDQLALQSTLTVLGERMATIRMKASGKRQLLEVGPQSQRLLFPIRSPLHRVNLINGPAVRLQEKLSEQLEGQRQEQALQRYHSEAEELDHWLLSTRATLSSALRPLTEDLDMEEQLIDCQVRRNCSTLWFVFVCFLTCTFKGAVEQTVQAPDLEIDTKLFCSTFV